jgi:hypothetical protein
MYHKIFRVYKYKYLDFNVTVSRDFDVVFQIQRPPRDIVPRDSKCLKWIYILKDQYYEIFTVLQKDTSRNDNISHLREFLP